MSPSRFGSGRRVQVNQSGGRYRAENSSRTSAPYSLVSLHALRAPAGGLGERWHGLPVCFSNMVACMVDARDGQAGAVSVEDVCW